MSETDRTSSGNAQVDILLSHRGQKVAYNNINVPQEKQHSNDAVGNDTSGIVETSCDIRASDVVPPLVPGFRTSSLNTGTIRTSALETSTFGMTAFGVNTTFGTNTSGMGVVSTNNVFRVNTSEQHTFGTIISPTPLKIDFHGFQVKVEHKSYLEGIYEKEGAFWSTCKLKVKEAIPFMLDILGNALVIADTPWSTISKKDLQHMLDSMDDAISTGFSLRCLDVCRQKAQSILSMDIDQPQTEAKLGEISKRITSLKQELQVITQELERQQAEELKLQEQLDAITHLRSPDSSPWSNIIE